MDVIGYIRVSTTNQTREDVFGLQVQESDIKKYVFENNYNLLKIYVDSGLSGATLNRPALSQMLTDAKEKKFKFVIVPKMDRLARDSFASLWIEKELLKQV